MKSSITSLYCKQDSGRICQGDILRDFTYRFYSQANETVEEIIFDYAYVCSQDCDLLQHFNKIKSFPASEGTNTEEALLTNNQFLPNVLILPAFLVDRFKTGEHLADLNKIKQTAKTTKEIDKIKNNNEERYHFIESNSELHIPELVLDFKYYLSIDYNYVRNNYSLTYLATINELFRERLAQRFSSYLSRIGLPEFNQS